MNKIRPLLYALLIGVVVFLVFQEVRSQEFLNYDDSVNVYDNPLLNPPSWANAAKFWTDFYFTVYTPLANTMLILIGKISYMTDPVITPTYSKTHLDSGTFHAANLLMHTLNAWLVFGFLRYLLRSDNGALVGALLFAIHPLQVEPVAWVTGWHTVFGGFFALNALWLFCVSINAQLPVAGPRPDTQSPQRPPTAVSKQWLLFLAATVFYTLSLLSKPIFMSVPLVALALDWGLTQRPWQSRAKMLLPWLVLTGLFWFINQVGQTDNKELNLVSISTPLWQRPLIVGDALTFYLRQFFLPLALGPDYGRQPHVVMQSPLVYLLWIIPTTLVWLALKKRQEYPAYSTAVVLFFLAVLPTSGIVPYYFHAYSTVADRYVYLGMLGPAILAGWLTTRFNPRFSYPVASIILLFLGARSLFQTYVYYNSISYFESALNVNPKSWMSYMDISIAYASAHYRDEAMVANMKAVSLQPNNPQPSYNLGLTFARSGDTQDAITLFEKAIKINPAFLPVYTAYATTLLTVGRKAEAVRAAATSVSLDPKNLDLLLGLASVQMDAGQYKEAASTYERVLRSYPGNEIAISGLRALRSITQKPLSPLLH